jgi:hypothetical protein
MSVSLKQEIWSAWYRLRAGVGTPQPSSFRRGIAYIRIGVLLLGAGCVFGGVALAQSASPIDPALQPVSQLQPATDSIELLPEAPAASKSPDAAPAQLHPGDIGFVPLTGQERASLFFRGYLGAPVSYLEMGASAGATWLAGEPEGWGRTFRGYGRRVGTEFVLYTTQEAVHDAGDAALGLDPRYFSCRCSGLWHRSRNALKMTLFAYDGNGKLRPDLPRIVGDYGSSMLVTSWYPASYSPLVQGVKMGHVQLGLDVGVNLLREFSPELRRFLRAVKLAKPAQN